ncbi:MAG: leucine-rich repeat domain-containing protein [Clostridia bacterium]|nr:leucine-rich repeat domain-containing protein [Clostridia bacterium]
MRRFRTIIWIICIAAALLTAACGDPAENRAESGSTPVPENTAEPGEEAVGVQTAAAETPAPVQTIELFGEEIPADAESLTIAAPVEDLSALSKALSALPACREVELTFAVDPEKTDLASFEAARAALFDAFPDVAFTDRILIEGEPAETVETLAVSSAEEIGAALRLCPALTCLDLTNASVSRESVAAAEQEAPAVKFLWTDAVYGASSSDATALAFSGEQDADALAAYLACFPALAEVDLTETALSDAQKDALCERFPDAAFRRTILLNGKPADSFAETLDFSEAKIASYEAFSDALQNFPKLKRLEMHDCSLTNKQLAAIRDRYPDVKVVWTVHVRGWRVRTDAVAFSSRQMWDNTNRVTSKNADDLRYCTDLIALDLGHNDLTDIEWIRPLKNLQVLILADNRKLKDISPLKELKKLKYIELFLTGVSDVTPLADHDELLDVNLCWSKVKDVSALLSCRKLERIWFGAKTAKDIGKEGISALKDAFPNAQFDLESTSTSTGAGWREHPRYDAYIEMFKTNKPVDPFLP